MSYLKKVSKTAAVILTSLLICTPVNANEADTYICDEYQDYINEVADEYGICPELIMAIVESESSGKANAKNGSCTGLMQVSKRVHADRMAKLGVKDLTDPYSNLLVGIDYIAELADEYEDLYIVLGRYHGETNIDVNNPSSYVTKIAARSEELERLHGK